MSCSQVNDTPEILSRLVDGELSPDEARRVEAHVKSCRSCAGELRELRELRRMLRAWSHAEAGPIAPSPSFRDRVVGRVVDRTPGRAARRTAAARPEPTRNGSATSSRRVPPARERAEPRGPRRLARFPLLFATSSAAAVLLIALGVWFGGSAGDATDPVSATDPVADVLAPRDLANADALLFAARSRAEAGDETGARALYLAVLSVDPEHPEALAALGFTAGAERTPIPSPRVPSLGLDRLDPDAFRPKRMVTVAPAEDFDEGIRFEGNLFSPLALDDFQRFRARQYRLAAIGSSRTVSVPQGGASEPRPKHPVMAMVSRLGPLEELPALKHRTLTVMAIVDPGRATAAEHEDGESERPERRRIVPIQQAFEDGIAVVVDGGSNLVFVTNRADDRDVFIPAGTLLIGGHQDRVVRRDIIVRGGRSEPTGVPVFCCEPGRSNGPSRAFRAAPFVAGPGLRRLILLESSQRLVWERIRIQLDRVGAKSRTEALAMAFGSGRVRRRLEAARSALAKLVEDPRVIGFVAADGERILGVDVFGDHELFVKLAPTFLDSYVFDSLTDRAVGRSDLSPRRVKRFLAAAAAGTLRERRGVDSGRDLTIGLADGVFGYAMVDEATRPVHVSLLPVPHAAAPPDAPDRGDDDDWGDDGDDDDEESEADGRGNSRADERIRDRRPKGRPARPGGVGGAGGAGGAGGSGGSSGLGPGRDANGGR